MEDWGKYFDENDEKNGSISRKNTAGIDKNTWEYDEKMLYFDHETGKLIDNRPRGKDLHVKKTKVSEMDLAEMITVPQREIDRFLMLAMNSLDEFCDMNIANTCIVRGFDGGELAGFDNYMRTVLEVNCEDSQAHSVWYLNYRLRLNFMKHHALMMNTLATAAMYAEFKGMKEGTVRVQIERGKYDLVYICGVRFILVSEEDMWAWNEFLMRRMLQKDIDTVDQANRKEIAEYYRKMYGRDAPSASDSVLEWLLAEGFYPEYNEDVAPHRSRKFTDDAYLAYRKWMKDEPVSLRVFALRIVEMGFKKFNVKKRGFWVWHYDAALYGEKNLTIN